VRVESSGTVALRTASTRYVDCGTFGRSSFEERMEAGRFVGVQERAHQQRAMEQRFQ
jgi:hypothetical protein